MTGWISCTFLGAERRSEACLESKSKGRPGATESHLSAKPECSASVRRPRCSGLEKAIRLSRFFQILDRGTAPLVLSIPTLAFLLFVHLSA